MSKILRTVNTREAREARLDEALDAELESLGAEAPETPESKAEKSGWEKRYSDLRSYSQKKENELAAQLKAVQDQLKNATEKQIKFPKSESEVEAWVKRYPDVAAIVETIAMKKVAEVRKVIDERDEALNDRAYQIEFDNWTSEIAKKHPDFFELKDNETFVEWLHAQPRYIKVAFGGDIPFHELEDAARTVISALTLYKLENTSGKRAKDDTRDAARSVKTGGRNAPQADRNENMIYESDVEKMPIREYTKKEADIEKAMREGRFVYDLTGGAR